MKPLSSPLPAFALLICLCAAAAGADEKASDDPEAVFAKLAAGKRQAVIGMSVEVPPGRHQPCVGAFISDAGLALINVVALLGEKKPSIMAAGRTPLKLGKVLGIIPEFELALVKFNHRPKVWLKFAEKDPEVGESIALVPLEMHNSNIWTTKTPPVVGPVMAKRSATSGNLRVPSFTKTLSLGARLSVMQQNALTPGCFAIDRRGNLVGFMGGSQVNQSQRLVFVQPIGDLPAQVARLVKGGKSVPFPLPPDANPIDMALLNDDYRGLHQAVQGRDQATARRHLKALLERYPESLAIKIFAATDANVIDPSKPLVKLEEFKVDPKAPKAQQVRILEARATIHILKGDIKGAIRELEAAVKPGLSPPDYPRQRMTLAGLYQHTDQLEEAEALFREIYPFNSDSIDFVAAFEALLIKQRNFDEARKLTDRAFELDEIYR